MPWKRYSSRYIEYKKVLLYNQYSSIKKNGKEIDLTNFFENLSKIDLEPELRNMVKEWAPVKYDSACLLLSLNKN